MIATEPSRAVKLYGTDVPDTRGRILRAGMLSLELDNGAVRYVRLSGVETLRGIAFLVRDENWGTFSPELSNLQVKESGDSFHVSYSARCGDANRELIYHAEIQGRKDGSLDFKVIAKPTTDFLTNRTGFVVLHPIDGCAGHPVNVEHENGEVISARFPESINPLQPFLDIRALSHEVMPGVWAECRMEGDIFEMEDHRNWTDASYKTYVRPLALPWPYTLPAGEAVVQSVSLRLRGQVRTAPASHDVMVGVKIGTQRIAALPKIGIGIPAEEAKAALDALDQLKMLDPAFLVCHFDPRFGHGKTELTAFAKLEQRTGVDVVLEIVLPNERAPHEEISNIAREVEAAGLVPAVVAVSPAPDLKAVLPGSPAPRVFPLEAIYAAAQEAFPGAVLGGGTFAFFTELNRKRPPTKQLDFITFTTTPITHAADDRSVMETLQAVPFITRTVKEFIDGKPFRVGPSAIGVRDNPYGQSTTPNPDGKRVCLAEADPRSRGLFGAAWALGYISALCGGGAEAVTVGAATGPLGVIYRKDRMRQLFFDGRSGSMVYPTYHVVSGLARSAGEELLSTECTRPTALAVLAHRDTRSGNTTVWLANLLEESQTVTIANLPDGEAAAKWLDEEHFVAATTNAEAFAKQWDPIADPSRVQLDGYAVLCIRFHS